MKLGPPGVTGFDLAVQGEDSRRGFVVQSRHVAEESAATRGVIQGSLELLGDHPLVRARPCGRVLTAQEPPQAIQTRRVLPVELIHRFAPERIDQERVEDRLLEFDVRTSHDVELAGRCDRTGDVVRPQTLQDTFQPLDETAVCVQEQVFESIPAGHGSLQKVRDTLSLAVSIVNGVSDSKGQNMSSLMRE